MGRLVNSSFMIAVLALVVVTAIAAVLLLRSEALAGTYAGWHTGYAMGKREGSRSSATSVKVPSG